MQKIWINRAYYTGKAMVTTIGVGYGACCHQYGGIVRCAKIGGEHGEEAAQNAGKLWQHSVRW